MSAPEFTAAVLKALRESGIEGELSHVRRESRYIGDDGELHVRPEPLYVAVMKDGMEYEMVFSAISGDAVK